MRNARLAAATLVFALAALPAAAANAVLGKPGGDYLIRADEVDDDVNSQVVTARGHVEIDYNDRMLTADQVTYDQKTDTVTASGHLVMVRPNGDVAFADHVVLTDQMRDGILYTFSALLGTNGRMAAAHATRSGGTVTTGYRAVFTHCKICNKPGQRIPTWQIKAYRAVYDTTAQTITFHDAVLDMFGVPVFYTPYFSQPDPSVKYATGILTPEFGSSSTLGQFVKLPVYVSLGSSQDITLAPTYTTESGELLEGEYRQRWDHGGMWLQPSIAYDPHGGLDGHERQLYSSLFGSGIIPVSSTWHVGYDAQLSSNDTYLKRYDISSDDLLTSDLFLESLNGRSRFAITGYFFQDLRAEASPATIPLALPLIELTYIPERNLLGGQFRFDLNSVALARDFGTDSQRLTAETRWRLPFVSADGQLITFQLDARGDLYRTTNNDPNTIDPTTVDLQGNPIPLKTHYISRALPYVALDWRWPFISSSPGSSTSFVLQPILQAIAAPYGGNPKGIPNEDSADFELDETDILSFDPLPGYDLWESGPRANAGFEAAAYLPTGSLDLLVAEAFRLKPDPIFSAASGIGDKKSDVIARLTIKFPPHLTLTHRVDIDQSDGSIRRNEVYVTGDYGRSSVQVSYIRLAQEALTQGLTAREEINGEATVGLWDNWAAFAGARRDLLANQMLDTEYGFGYQDECLGISLSYRRKYTRDRDVPPSTAFLLRIKLIPTDHSDETEHLFPRRVFSTP
jgi:LPS-assembly protein